MIESLRRSRTSRWTSSSASRATVRSRSGARLERARELPCKVRIFHSLVLPDDLMDPRARLVLAPLRPVHADERALLPRLVRGRALASAAASSRWPTAKAARSRRTCGRSPGLARCVGPRCRSAAAWSRRAPRSGPKARRRSRLPARTCSACSELGIKEATSGGWTFVEASARPGEIVVIMKTRDGALVVEMRPASPTENAYKVVDGVAFGYRSPRGVKMSDGALRLLDRVLQRLHAPARTALGLSTQDGGPGSARVRRFRATPS